jgi:hypothetical protein
MRAWLVFGIAIAAAPRLAFAVCGDGVLDPGESCEPSSYRCCTATCERIDDDGDGLCNDEDICRQSTLARATEVALRITGLTTPEGDEQLRFTGRYKVSTTLFVDPSVDGFRFGLNAGVGESAFVKTTLTLLTARIPGGKGWTARSESFRYRDPKGTHGGVTSVELKRITPAPVLPNDPYVRFAFIVKARRGHYDVTPEMVQLYDFSNPGPFGQLFTQLALGTTGDGYDTCAQNQYPSYTVQPTVPCTFSPRGDAVTCSGPPPIGPCRVGEPQDVTTCETLTVASLEDAYFAAHGEYFNGPCAELPGYVRTLGTTCSLTATTSAYLIAVANVAAPGFVCQYMSASTPQLFCS